MDPLQTCRRVLTWLCGVPPEESASKQEKIQYIVFTVVIMMIHVVGVICGAVFIYRKVSIDLEATLFCLFHTAALLQTFYQTIATILLRRKFIVIFENLKQIYNESEN